MYSLAAGRGMPQFGQQGQSRGSQREAGSDGNFVRANAKAVIAQSKQLSTAREEKDSGANGSLHENYGRVPQYLLDANANAASKKTAAQEAEKEKQSGVPKGMVLMPEDQRIKTLEVLNESQSDGETERDGEEERRHQSE
jgi:hypothetical protein